jgi:hypothetical protein
MTLALLLIILAVAVAWALAAWAMWKWAPGEKRMKVWCPVFQREAKIVAIEGEAESAPPGVTLPFFQLKECSLFKGRVVNCRTECLRRP